MFIPVIKLFASNFKTSLVVSTNTGVIKLVLELYSNMRDDCSITTTSLIVPFHLPWAGFDPA